MMELQHFEILVNLALPKVFIQLFHMQVHTPYVQARYDILFQIRFCDFSDPQNSIESYNM